MVFSYSAAAQSGAAKASASNSAAQTDDQPVASSSKSPINHLILDAGPLLSLTPLRHLATTFHTTPLVFSELRDPKAREHWSNLALSGVEVRTEAPSAEAMSKVVEFAKKTGDFAVLSQTDLSVIALTYQYEVLENGLRNIRTEPGQRKTVSPEQDTTGDGRISTQADDTEADGDAGSDGTDDEQSAEEVTIPSINGVESVSKSIEQVLLDGEQETTEDSVTEQDADVAAELSVFTQRSTPVNANESNSPQDEDNESDGGEWITPSNVTHHRNRDLGLLPDDNSKTGALAETIAAACMTGDFAVQNVLLGMGLGLVGEGGKRISKVKSFVLRCHACFKICKDPSKRFCPSCGNPSLLRTTVTTSATTGQQRVHLKKNFQYHLRGSKYTIPDAKPGRAKGQQKGGSGLILREDQVEWQNAVRSEDIKRQKEERRAAKGALEGWNDPDWMPEIITVGMSGKGRSGGRNMPAIGHGRKNPNQARRKR